MDLGPIIEVAIGIIFVWIVLSLTTIQIQEWVSTRLDKRAKDMEASIHEMLANPNLKAQFYDHPVIRGLTAKKRRNQPSETPPWYYRWPVVRGFTKEKRRVPSYIPSQQFAIALFDIVLTAGTESSVIQQGILKIRDDLQEEKKLTVFQAVIDELNILADFARSAAATEAGTAITNRTLDGLKTEADQFISKLKQKYPKYPLDPAVEEKIRRGIEEALDQAKKRKKEMDDVLKRQPKTNAKTALSKVRHGIAALSVISPEFNQTLNALLLNVEEFTQEKEKELARARGNVEKWFDDAMDRVSGAFKRYSQRMALIIGFLIALFANVDSIGLTLYLWREPTIRAVLAANAQEFNLQVANESAGGESNPYTAIQDLRDQFSGLNLPVGWTLKDLNDPLFAVSGSGCTPFPKGAEYFGIALNSRCLTSAQPDHSTNLLLKLLGIIITAIAARQGAPFWFDILKRAVNLRGTGANPAEKENK